VSLRSISDLEHRVNKTGRRETTRLLADALNLCGATRAGFETARAATRPLNWEYWKTSCTLPVHRGHHAHAIA
jgi:hypothetical protein